MFDKVVIANRGEIAVRVIRACRELGVTSVAVYSEADRLAPHVWLADEAHEIGPARASESYLSIERLLRVAEESGSDAVHPGYGFLAENADFARACEARGFVFIGPTADTIALMGDKTQARRLMKEAGVPVVPGSESALSGVDEIHAASRAVGYPVLLKAAAGGGGKGMRRVDDEAELESAWGAASREAQAAFSDPRVYVEKYLVGPRHVEIQMLADDHGNIVHLGERECTIQRRHQKLIEESPSPIMTAELREQMGQTAIAAARSAGYRGAGTVEFLFADGEFYFLEMNTRLQVEHPVTEMVTDVDLVQAQLRLAAGERLWLDSLTPQGHSIECRISAEDPLNDFLPAVGRVEHLRTPGGPGVRWDAGIVQGTEVGLHYDSLIAKLIVRADDRRAAITRMARALDELVIDGLRTTATFHRRVVGEADFQAGEFDTGYLEAHPELLDSLDDEQSLEAAALVAALLEDAQRREVRFEATDGGGRGGRGAGGGGGGGGGHSAWRWPGGGWSRAGWSDRGWRSHI